MTTRFFEVDYYIQGQQMQRIRIQATDTLAARKIVEAMFGASKPTIGLIREVR